MILITGSGRSGTSAVARLIHQSGVSVGHDLIAPDEGNAEGYYEERAVVTMNETILASIGLHEWFAKASREQIVGAAGDHAGTMRALVANATPAWKDPRFSWTLEAWLPHLPEPARIVVCLRSPVEVIASTARYFGLSGDEHTRAVEHVWRSEYERLLEVIADHALDAITVEYTALQDDPDRATEPLARFVGRSLDASAAVRRDLRHHRAPVPEGFRDLYDRVRALGDAYRTTPEAAPESAARLT
jgi:hypothetical protein